MNLVTQILTRYLKEHPEFGLHLMLAEQAVLPSEQQTVMLKGKKLPCAIYNNVDDEDVAKKYDPKTCPALILVGQLSSATDVKPNGKLEWPAHEVSLSYMERDTPFAAATKRCGYVLRAVSDSLRAFNDSAAVARAAYKSGPDTWGRMLDIDIVEIVSLEEFRAVGSVGTASMFGTLIATMRVKRTLS